MWSCVENTKWVRVLFFDSRHLFWKNKSKCYQCRKRKNRIELAMPVVVGLCAKNVKTTSNRTLSASAKWCNRPNSMENFPFGFTSNVFFSPMANKHQTLHFFMVLFPFFEFFFLKTRSWTDSSFFAFKQWILNEDQFRIWEPSLEGSRIVATADPNQRRQTDWIAVWKKTKIRSRKSQWIDFKETKDFTFEHWRE